MIGIYMPADRQPTQLEIGLLSPLSEKDRVRGKRMLAEVVNRLRDRQRNGLHQRRHDGVRNPINPNSPADLPRRRKPS
jgi:hypothetical protein